MHLHFISMEMVALLEIILNHTFLNSLIQINETIFFYVLIFDYNFIFNKYKFSSNKFFSNNKKIIQII